MATVYRNAKKADRMIYLTAPKTTLKFLVGKFYSNSRTFSHSFKIKTVTVTRDDRNSEEM